MLASLLVIVSVGFDVDLAAKEVNRRVSNLPGIVVSVSADTKGSDDWEPPRDCAACKALCDSNADALQ